jgi:hypothetical protein
VIAPENFVLRWARLKRGSKSARQTMPVENDRQPEAVAAPDGKTPTPHEQDEVIDLPFDPASLPSIETIAGDTDIRGFLQGRVPAALTRAALRQAWASDPAIRDFVGIAENQWDFNDPTAMPGFGPMREADNLPTLLARATGVPDKPADLISDVAAPVESVTPSATDRGSAELSKYPRQSSDRPAPANAGHNLPKDGAATIDDRVAENEGFLGSHRSHGSALPRQD